MYIPSRVLMKTPIFFLVRQAVNTNSEKQLRKAISIAPRGKRAASGMNEAERRSGDSAAERWDGGDAGGDVQMIYYNDYIYIYIYIYWDLMGLNGDLMGFNGT